MDGVLLFHGDKAQVNSWESSMFFSEKLLSFENMYISNVRLQNVRIKTSRF